MNDSFTTTNIERIENTEKALCVLWRFYSYSGSLCKKYIGFDVANFYQMSHLCIFV